MWDGSRIFWGGGPLQAVLGIGAPCSLAREVGKGYLPPPCNTLHDRGSGALCVHVPEWEQQPW